MANKPLLDATLFREPVPQHLDERGKALWDHVGRCIISPDVGDSVKDMCFWIKRELLLQSKCTRLEKENRKLRSLRSTVG